MKVANGTDTRYEKVDISDPESDASSSDSTRSALGLLFRTQRARFAVMVVMLFLCSFSNNVVGAFIHDKVPPYKPLPDLFFGTFQEAPGLLKFTETCIMVSATVSLAMVFCSPKRWLYGSRVAYIASLLYLGRAVCFCVTVLPVASPNFACEGAAGGGGPRNRTTTPLALLKRITRNFFALGIETTGVSAACGDYIYSGHTVVSVLASLIMREYSPKRLQPWLPWAMYIVSAMAMFGILITRLHYTIDVILAYFLTTRLFWSYHLAVAVRGLTIRVPRRGDLFSRLLWYPFLEFIEADTL